MSGDREPRGRQAAPRTNPGKDSSKANAFLIKDPNDQALRSYVEARDQVIKQVLEAVGGQSETVRKIFGRGLTLTGSGGGALSTERGRKSAEAQRLGALKEVAQLQVLDWCVKRACELGGLTEQNLAKAYEEFKAAAEKVVPKDLLFYENGVLAVKEGLFGKDNLWKKVQDQVLATKQTPKLTKLDLQNCLSSSKLILESIKNTCAAVKKDQPQQPQTSPQPEATNPTSPSPQQAFTLLETQQRGIKALAVSENTSQLPQDISTTDQHPTLQAQVAVYKERSRRPEEPIWTGLFWTGSTWYNHQQSKEKNKPSATPPGGGTPQPGNPPNSGGPNNPVENHPGGGGGNPAQNNGGQQGGGTQQPTAPRPAGPNDTGGPSPAPEIPPTTEPRPAGPNETGLSGSTGNSSPISNEPSVTPPSPPVPDSGSNINNGQPNLGFAD